jgi:hypothetical protein
MRTDREIDSLIVSGESSATHNGEVETRITELATVVYASEVIQVAKWIARNSPERTVRILSRLVKASNSIRCLDSANGARTKVARVNRYAAMTRDGAYSWAYRMKIEAVEIARIPKRMTMSGGNGGCWGEPLINL